MTKLSKQYRDLEPYIVDTVRSIVGHSGSGSGGSSTVGIKAHRLDDTSVHLGSLATSQAPWAITTSVFSAHTGNSDAHHNQVHAINGTDHTATGSKWQVVGLSATNILGLLTPSADVSGATKEAILKSSSTGTLKLVDIQATGTIYADDILDFGTDYIQEGVSYLSFIGSKPISFGQTVRATGWSITAGGAITASDDLTIGSNILFVDYSLLNVGINCAPDPQFALDINGPARAQYFIGPHAIQLKDAVLIAHFDGPGNNDIGEPNGHMGQIPTVSGTVSYRYGKFGKAVEISSVHSNMCTSNPSFETDAVGTPVPTGWSTYQVGTASGGRAVTDVKRWDSTKSLRIWKTGGAESDNWGIKAPNVATAASTNYAITVRVYLEDIVSSTPTGSIATLVALCGAVSNSASTYVTDEWVELALKITSDAGASAMQIWVSIDNCATGTVYVDALQMIQSNAHRPYVAGTSTASSFAYDNLALNWGAFSVSAWVYLTDIATSSNVTLRPFSLNVHGDTTARIEPYFHNSTSKLYAQYVPSGGAGQPTSAGTTVATAQAWHHVAMTVAGRLISVYLDGALQGTVTATGMQSGLAQLYVGMYNGGNQINGMIDDLAVCNRTWTATEVLAIYESNAPVFAESSIWSFRATPKGLVWADEEGLWMRDAAGAAVLGIYGGSSTKVWGGVTLSTGDLLIGDDTQYVLWDSSSADLSIKGSITADTGYIGGTSGWLIATYQLTSNNIRLYAGVSGVARVEVGDGVSAYQAGMLSGSTSGSIAFWAGSLVSDAATAPLRITRGGALTATNATISGAITASSGSVTGNFYAGTSAIRLSTDGQRFVLPDITSINVPTSSSALRWFPGIDETHAATGDYTGLVGYRHTSNHTVDMLYTAYVGETNAATYAARFILQAGHQNTSHVYTDARLEVVREAGTGARYVGIIGDRLEVENALALKPMTAPAAWTYGALIYLNTANGDLEVIFSNGTTKTLAPN